MTPKQKAFVSEYIRDRNATQAAIRAGYKADNADVTGPRLLGNVGIAQAIAAATEKVAERAGIDAAWVLKEQRSLYAQTKGTNEEVARKCLRDIGEHLGMYVERVESTNTNVSYVVETPAKFDKPTWQQRYSQLQ
jgi:phage terminase small subunit